LTLVAALAVSEGSGKPCGLETQIKWPNDIVADGKKICGILTEMSTELECINYVVTGMGINANMEDLPEEIKDVATSILLQTGKRVKRSQLIGAVMESYEKYYNVFMESGNMSGLLDVYNSHLANMQRSVRVLQPGSEYVGTALGINDAGELLVKTEDGAVHQVISGEVSVRGIYGYV
ncbi:MAG: biotin--[acetyl-CoA-carboxylase] ligase, partial [[Clostridium] symbiosum]